MTAAPTLVASGVRRRPQPSSSARSTSAARSIIPNAVRIAELAFDKQVQTLLMPVAARRQLNDLLDELWTRINIEFYKDASDTVFKSLVK